MQTHRHIAKRKALYWQVGAVAILAAAGAVIALPQIGSLFAPAAPKKSSGPVVPPKVDPPDYTKLELAKANKGASETGPQVAIVPPAPIPEPPLPTAEQTPTQQAATAWEYLGSIITPRKRSALVRVDGQQQMYTIGSPANGDAKLVTIEKDYIEVEIGAEKELRKIALKDRVLLTPTEMPKHMPALRQSPVIGMGSGATMNFNAASRAAAPAATLEAARAEQARMAALAAAEMAARARMAVDVPGMTPLEKLEAGDVEAASKYLSDPSIADDSRGKYLRMLGIGPGISMDTAMTRLREAGVDTNGAAGKALLQAVQNNSQSKP